MRTMRLWDIIKGKERRKRGGRRRGEDREHWERRRESLRIEIQDLKEVVKERGLWGADDRIDIDEYLEIVNKHK